MLYLLNQLQNKPKSESAEKETQKDGERSNEQELLHRHKIQVPLIKVDFSPISSIHFKYSHNNRDVNIILGRRTSRIERTEPESAGAEWAI